MREPRVARIERGRLEEGGGILEKRRKGRMEAGTRG